MGCQVSTNQAPQQPTTVLPANLPQNQADWSRFIQRMQEVLSAIHAAGYTTGVNVVPTQYSIYDGTALPGLRLTGATSSLDSANVQFGAASLKLVATGTQIVLTLSASGYPATMQPYWKWIASLYCRTDQASLSGTLAVTTAAGTYTDDISGAVTALAWSRLYGNYDLTADASTSCTLTLTLNTTAGATYWLEAWQLEPVQGNTALPSPFIFTSPPRTWGQLVNDGNKPANNADVTSQNTAADTSNVAGTPAATVVNNASSAANQVSQLPIINPNFGTGDLTGWTSDYGSWSFQQGSAGPETGTSTYAIRTGSTGTPTDTLRNSGKIKVYPGARVKAACSIRGTGTPDGTCSCLISWRDANNAEISVSQGNTVTGNTLAASFVAGTAPAGAISAHIEAAAINHTVGTYTVDGFIAPLLPDTMDQVPDGTTRFGAVLTAAQQQATYTPGGNLIPNAQPSMGSSFWTLGSGWSYYSGYGGLLGGVPGFSLTLNTTPQTSVCSSATVPVSAGVAISASIDVLVNGPCSAGDFSADVQFLNSSGGSVGGSSRIFTLTANNSTFQRYVLNNILPPTGAATAYVRFFCEGATSSAGAQCYVRRIKLEGGTSATPFNDDTTQFGNKLTEAGSGQTLGNQLNAPNSLTLNYGAARNATALTATSAGVVNVNAHSINMGGATVSYNAVSNAVTGLTVGTTYQIYCRDPGGTGGTKTWYAVAGNQDAVLALGYDDAVLGGQVTIPSSGTGGGGGTGCPQVDEPVIRRRPDGDGEVIRAGDVRDGDYIWLTRGRWGRVSYSEAKLQPGVRVVGQDGSSITCSTSAPLETAEGPCVSASEVQGLVLWHRRAGVMRIHDVIDLGPIWVQHITCEDDRFLVGDYSHHNMKP